MCAEVFAKPEETMTLLANDSSSVKLRKKDGKNEEGSGVVS